MKNSRNEVLAADLLERFQRYVRVYTTSVRPSLSATKPSSERQWDLLKLLHQELLDLGLTSVQTHAKGYVLGTLPASPGLERAPSVAFLAHVDTSPDAPGENVRPLVHHNYDGRALTLAGVVLDPQDNPVLGHYVGKTIVTSDGTTLLGADDKAGISEILAAVAYLKANPELPHPAIEVIFTSDEEVGRGVEDFPYDLVKSRVAYTLDGDEEGTLEAECYNAHMATVRFQGRSYHPGSARGKMVNAVNMVANFVNLLPRNESPEATDGRYGCLWANDLQAGVESASVEIYLRDFDLAQSERRLASLHAYARAVEAQFPGGTVTIETQVQYLNMKAKLDEHPRIVELLKQAIRQTGIEPREKSIRGGTDGARLTEAGLPTPNIFTGGMNYHSRTEWIALDAMVRASNVVIELVGLWARESTGRA